ncbi:hypothetical protein CONPUDRAFT_121279 [Coniophora puteana RWD-64-598 SS2]|uniref:Transmembrane protein n=1 Tax=Coniophora puteana (strain RWD-64-598) TaxID=741705 RepID=A0A5M3MW88_CONPW|nr:uncharacterized protein CONPUDRAFT_121279 [Coniophora puteana RWD-64-598 SS2]EIW83004.1 hypothetical protein CONPUDRAFT_121279 [Coniophora puteana RWD-64-598 SS2]
MPLVTTLIDDTSPLITYDPSWIPGTSADDNDASDYFLGTFTDTNVTNAQASFSFNGTSFYIFGSKRPNHGTYSIEVDGKTFSNIEGNSANSLFQQALFNGTGLSQGMHNVSLTNTGSGTNTFVDIDLVVWDSEVGSDSEQLATVTVEDTDPGFNYQSVWTTDPPNAMFYSQGSGHSTSVENASVTLTFTGDIVSVFGTVGPNNGQYSVALDNGPPTSFNATRQMTYYRSMLYHADNLGSGQHQLNLVNLPESTVQFLNIDYALISSLASSGNSVASGQFSLAATNTNRIPPGAIAGIVIPIVAALIGAALAVLFFRRWKMAEAARNDLYRVYSPQRDPRQPHYSTGGSSYATETRSNSNLVRNDVYAGASTVSHTSYLRSPQDYGYQGSQQVTAYPDYNHGEYAREPRMEDTVLTPSRSVSQSTVARHEEPVRRPLPEAPAGPSPFASEKAGGSAVSGAVQAGGSRRISASDTIADMPPPNYVQAIHD